MANQRVLVLCRRARVRRPERDRAEDVRRAGLLTLRWRRPDDLVERHELDGPAAGEERVAVGERGARTDERAGAIGRYILWPLARKSAVAGSGRWGASWAASTSTGTPRSCARTR